jgi:hypothetical protein
MYEVHVSFLKMTNDQRIDYSTFQPLVRRINSPDYPDNPVPSGFSQEADLAARKILHESSNARALAEHPGLHVPSNILPQEGSSRSDTPD